MARLGIAGGGGGMGTDSISVPRNIIDQYEELKGWPDDKIEAELQSPTGLAPEYLVFSEARRRIDMRQRYENESAGQNLPQVSMVEELLGGGQPGPPQGSPPPPGGPFAGEQGLPGGGGPPMMDPMMAQGAPPMAPPGAPPMMDPMMMPQGESRDLMMPPGYARGGLVRGFDNGGGVSLWERFGLGRHIEPATEAVPYDEYAVPYDEYYDEEEDDGSLEPGEVGPLLPTLGENARAARAKRLAEQDRAAEREEVLRQARRAADPENWTPLGRAFPWTHSPTGDVLYGPPGEKEYIDPRKAYEKINEEARRQGLPEEDWRYPQSDDRRTPGLYQFPELPDGKKGAPVRRPVAPGTGDDDDDKIVAETPDEYMKYLRSRFDDTGGGLGQALIAAGTTMMQTPGSALTAIGAGGQAGLATYTSEQQSVNKTRLSAAVALMEDKRAALKLRASLDEAKLKARYKSGDAMRAALLKAQYTGELDAMMAASIDPATNAPFTDADEYIDYRVRKAVNFDPSEEVGKTEEERRRLLALAKTEDKEVGAWDRFWGDDEEEKEKKRKAAARAAAAARPAGPPLRGAQSMRDGGLVRGRLAV